MIASRFVTLLLVTLLTTAGAWAAENADADGDVDDVGSPQAHAASLAPRDVLSAVLRHDFKGFGAFRIGWTHRTDGKGDWVGDRCCRSPRDDFTPLQDDSIVVSSWEIIEAETATANAASFAVRFHVVGRAGHVDGRSAVFTVADNIHDETITYRLQVRKGEWVILDPPLPRVGVMGLKKVAEKDLKKSQEYLASCVALVAKGTLKLRDPPQCDGLRRSIFEDEAQLGDLGPILEAAQQN